MAFRLPRLRDDPIVNDGKPTFLFKRWWQSVVSDIETAITSIEAILSGLTGVEGSLTGLQAQADILADEVVDLADTTRIGVKVKTNDKGEVETTEGDMVERTRLQIDARKWYAGKLAPKKYGDKLAVGGDDSMDPIRHAVDATLTPAEAYRKLIG